MDTRPAIQSMAEFKTERDAAECFAFMRLQTDYIGGRVLPPDSICPVWRVQTFHDPGDFRSPGWLPDGMRFVTVPCRMLLNT